MSRKQMFLIVATLIVALMSVSSFVADAQCLMPDGSAEAVSCTGGGNAVEADAPSTGTYLGGPILYDNGPLYNFPGSPNVSRLQVTSLGMTTIGFTASDTGAFRMADDFTIPAGETWVITGTALYGYQTGSSTTSTFDTVRLQIWSGNPNAGGTIVFGDTTTNRFLSGAWDNGYRDTETTVGNTTRPIMRVVGTSNIVLTAGTYWIDYQLGGTLASGPFSPPITITGQNTTGNAQQWNGTTWVVANDGGSLTPQGIPFQILGSVQGGNTPTATATPDPVPTNTPTATPGGPTATATATVVAGTCSFDNTLSQFYFTGFESDDGGWVESGFGEWERGAVVTGTYEFCDTAPAPEPSGPFAGTNVFATNLNGCYQNSNQDSVLSQTFDFSSRSAPIFINLHHWYHVFETFDFAIIRVNGTQVFRTPNSNPTANYVPQLIDLSAYAGNPSVNIEFLLHTTTVVNRMGWYVDNIELCSAGSGATPTPTSTGAPPTNTPTATNTPTGPTNTPTATATPGGGGNRFCSTVPITIPDANPTGATGTITVGSAGTISDLNVIITGTHTWVGDIRLNLSNGTTNVTFYDQPGVPASTFGCSGDNLPGVVADDEGVNGSFENSCQNATPAYTPGGSYTNNNPLSAFDGSATNATWTLTASDLAAGDTGTIDSWCVEFGTGAGPTPTATPTAGQVPDINLNPSSFNETHSSPPQTTTDTLNVQNVGAGNLTWTIAEDDSRPGTLMSAKGEYLYNGAVQDVSGFSSSGVAGNTIINTPNVAQGSLFITHSSTQNITALNSVSCNAGGLHTDNSYYRVYDLAGDFGITQTIEVDEVSFGVEQATGATGSQPVTVNLYTLTGVLNTANLTLIGSEATSVPDSATGTVFSVPVSPEVVVPAGSVLVVELFTPNGQTAGNSFFIGSNADPETDPSYLRAPDCGVAQPTATGAIGFPNMHIVMNVSAGIVGGGACTAPTDIPWLTVAPTNGSTSGGGSTPVTLTYNSTSLAQGVYTGTLCVASNDPDEALVTVPITLNVGPPTAIDLASFTSPMNGVNLADLAAAGLLLLAGAVLVLRRK